MPGMSSEAPSGSTDPTATASAVRQRLHDAFGRLVAEYQQSGGYRFHGWTTDDEPRNYHGPLFWSEADGVFRLALELEKEFPRQVHCELKVDKNTRLDFPSEGEKRQQVDIGVSDLAGFVADETAYDRFRRHQHLLFVEAKWFPKGYRGFQWEYVARDQVNQVQGDLDKLARHLRLGRCAVAAMLVIDDEDFFAEGADGLSWPAGVERLICGPAELRRRGLF
jgi:hypothetical protein